MPLLCQSHQETAYTRHSWCNLCLFFPPFARERWKLGFFIKINWNLVFSCHDSSELMDIEATHECVTLAQEQIEDVQSATTEALEIALAF